MAHNVNFEVSGHQLTLTDQNFRIIQENTDYRFVFDLDAEWRARTNVYATFKYPNGNYVDKKLDAGHSCNCPAINNTTLIYVGLHSPDSASDYISTGPLQMKVKESILTDRKEELSGSINMSTADVLAKCKNDLAVLEATYNKILSGKTAVIVDVTP